MFRMKRRGIALIAVVLISALLFVSIIGIAIKVIPENKIITARSFSQRALTAAESGINQVIFNLSNSDFDDDRTVPEGTTEPKLTYLTIGDVKAIRDGGNGFTLLKTTSSPNPYLSGTPATTYWVRITKNNDTGEVNNREIVLTLHSMGIVFQDKDNDNELDTADVVLARKVLETKVTYLINITKTDTIEGALISGGDINFNGNANTVFYGDVYADGNIDLNSENPNDCIVLDGDAYSHGYTDENIVCDPDKRHENAPSNSDTIANIIQNFMWYVSPNVNSISDAFIGGTDPYDATDEDYNPEKFPNTNREYLGDPATSLARAQVDNIMSYYLGDPTNFSLVASFYNDLVSGKIFTDNPGLKLEARAFFENLLFNNVLNIDYSEKIVTYFQQTGKKPVDNKLFEEVDYKLGGVLIIDGDLSLTGNFVVNPDNNPLIVIVTGDVSLNGGGGPEAGIFNGSIFASNPEGKVSAGNVTINGALISPGKIEIDGGVTCNGTVISQTEITLKGTNNIYYNRDNLPTFLQTGTPIEYNYGNDAQMNESTWKEKAYVPEEW